MQPRVVRIKLYFEPNLEYDRVVACRQGAASARWRRRDHGCGRRSVAPTLTDLRDPFRVRLGRAEDEANDKLDVILSEGQRPLIKPVDLGLRNRELATEADVEALGSEIRTRLLEQIRAGTRVRLV